MITGWGAHHLDTAHWAMGTEYTGPVEVEAEASFPQSGLWNVHGDFMVHSKYANGVTMEISGSFPNGVRFEGTEGWIFVSRGNVTVTSSDPTKPGTELKALDASDPKILKSEIGPDEIHLYKAPEQHEDWLNAIQSRKRSGSTRRSGTPFLFRLPGESHCHEATRQTALGSGPGKVHGQ